MFIHQNIIYCAQTKIQNRAKKLSLFYTLAIATSNKKKISLTHGFNCAKLTNKRPFFSPINVSYGVFIISYKFPFDISQNLRNILLVELLTFYMLVSGTKIFCIFILIYTVSKTCWNVNVGNNDIILIKLR